MDDKDTNFNFWRMIMRLRFLEGLAVAALLTLGLSATAHAQTTTWGCEGSSNPVPPAPSGDTLVQAIGDCTIGDVTVNGGSLEIDAGGNTTTGNLSATAVNFGGGANIQTGNITATNGRFSANAAGGNLTTGSITTTTAPGTYVAGSTIDADATGTVTIDGNVSSGDYVTSAGHVAVVINGTVSSGASQISGQAGVYLSSEGTVSSGAITSYGGQISIHPYDRSANTIASSPFNVGAGGVNGVSGAINANGTAGSGGIYITNAGSGGIVVRRGGDLSAKSSSTAPGYIILDACNENDTDPACTGAITIGAGTIASDGTSAFIAGGQIYIANTISLSGTKMTADDTAPAPSNPFLNYVHTVVLAANTITLNGAGLTATANGPKGGIQINNFGATSAADNFQGVGNPPGVSLTVAPTTPLTISGSGALSLTSNGEDTRVSFQGAGLTFASTLGDVTVNANRKTAVVSVLTPAGTALAFNETAPVVINSNGDAAGGAAGTGDAGTINISAGSVTSPVMPLITLQTNGTNNGKGGTQTITTNSNITLGILPGEFQLSANGGATGGDAGSITVTVGAGNQATMDIPAIAGTPFVVSATAQSPAGLGGKVTIDHAVNMVASLPINVNAGIKVDGGSSIGDAALDGSINLNNVTCQQWQTGLSSWPLSYWDCVHPGHPAGAEPTVADGANSLESQLKSQLGNTLTPANPSVQIYVMPLLTSYQTFFARSIVNDIGVYGATVAPIRVSNSFTSVYTPNGGTEDSATFSNSISILEGAMVHELGHELDYIWGNISTQNSWTSLRVADFANMNAQPCTTVFPPALTDACQHYAGQGLSNSEIFLADYPAFVDTVKDPNGGDIELFAAVFEHVEATETNPSRYSVEPKLENALVYLPGMIGYMQGLIANPPAAVN
jgi:hypothetical protein